MNIQNLHLSVKRILGLDVLRININIALENIVDREYVQNKFRIFSKAVEVDQIVWMEFVVSEMIVYSSALWLNLFQT